MATTTTYEHIDETVHHHDPASAARELKEAEHERRLELEDLKRRRTATYAFGRLLIASLFLVSALVKMFHYSSTLDSMAAAGLTDEGVILPAAVLIELVGGAMIALGFRVRLAAIGLIGYLIMVTLLVHGDQSIDTNRVQALCNLALGGGLLLLVGHGAGSYSVDRWTAHRSAKRYAA
jgi:putative oxidoreductase